jgi:hypothetical protein
VEALPLKENQMTYHADLGFEPPTTTSADAAFIARREQRLFDSEIDKKAAAIPDLSVKSYVVSGVTVWASYQSPAADAAIKRMKQEINRFGAGLDVNGLVGPKTTSALKLITSRYSGASGLTGAKVRELASIAAGGEQMVAKRASEVWSFVYDLAEQYGFIKHPAVAVAPKTGEGGGAQIPPPPAGTVPPPPGIASAGIMGILKSPLGLAALAVGVVLVVRSMQGRGGSRGRKTKRVRALARA